MPRIPPLLLTACLALGPLAQAETAEEGRGVVDPDRRAVIAMDPAGTLSR